MKSVSGETFTDIIGYESGSKPEWDQQVADVVKMFDATYIDPNEIPF